MTKITVGVIAIIAGVLYLSFLVPFILVNNLDDVRIIRHSENIPASALPGDIKDELGPAKDSYDLLFIEDILGSEKWAVIPIGSETFSGNFVKVTYKSVEWNIDWHAYDFINYPSDKLIMGEVKSVGPLNSLVQTLIYPRLNKTLYSLSKLDYYLGGLFFVFLLSFLLRGSLAFWNVPAIISCYSFSSFLNFVIPMMYNLGGELSFRGLIFGIIPVILVPFTLKSYHAGNKSLKNNLK